MLWNEGARRLYGYEPAEIVGRPNPCSTRAEDVKAGLPEAMMDAARRHGEWQGMVQRVRQDGSAFTARVVITPRRGVDGTPGGFLLISSDVTAEVELTTRRGTGGGKAPRYNVELSTNVELEAADVAKNRLPGQHEPRAAHTAERDPRVHRNDADGAAGATDR